MALLVYAINFATGDMSNTNFTGVKYKKNLGDDFTFVGSGFAGRRVIEQTVRVDLPEDFQKSEFL